MWETLHGTCYKKMGTYNIIYNLLYQMGIMANVDIYPEESVNRYRSIDEAIADQRSGYNVTRRKTGSYLERLFTDQNASGRRPVCVARDIAPGPDMVEKRRLIYGDHFTIFYSIFLLLRYICENKTCVIDF